jgi:hypothetical protein
MVKARFARKEFRIKNLHEVINEEVKEYFAPLRKGRIGAKYNKKFKKIGIIIH